MFKVEINKLLFGIGLISLLVLSGCIQVYEEPTALTGDPIILGALLPLSGPGTVYGEPARKILQIAADEINAKGGIEGRPIQFEFDDGGCRVDSAKVATESLVNIKGVKVIIGGLCSSETLTAAPIAEENHVVLLSYASNNQSITNAGDYVFRNFPSDETQGAVLAEYAKTHNFTKIGILVEKEPTTTGITSAFIDSFGGETITETFSTDDSDFATQIAALQAAEVDVYMLAVYTPDKVELLLKQLQEAGVNGPFLLSDVVIGSLSNVLSEYKELLEESVGTQAGYSENHPGIAALQKKYFEQEGEEIPYMYVMAPAYDAVYIIKEAIETVGEDPVKIKAYLYSVKGRKGLAGELSFDENGDSNYRYEPVIIKGGVLSHL